MKNLILTIAICSISIINVFANNEPAPVKTVFTIDAISFEMDATVKTAHNMEIIFSKEENTLALTSATEVNFIQVLNNDGSLEYQLPVFSKEIVIDLDDFNQGDYQMNLIVKKDEIISSTFSK